MQLHLLKLRGKRGLQTTGVQFNSEQKKKKNNLHSCVLLDTQSCQIKSRKKKQGFSECYVSRLF